MGAMKTQIIQLDEHDDVISVRDKMAWTKSPRILLVFPHRARILSRNLDLLLLKRHAAALGAQFAVVTRSADFRGRCAGLGIPVFATSAAAQRADWGEMSAARLPSRRGRPPNLRAMRREIQPAGPPGKDSTLFRLSFFLLGVLAVLAILLLLLPSAAVELVPQTQVQSLAITVRASSGATSVGLTGVVPARNVTTTLGGSRTAAVTGQAVVPEAFAAGSVRFGNLTDRLVGIPAGTVVRTAGSPPVRFATQGEAVLPSGAGRTVDVPVRALAAGPAGNLPAGALTAIEGALGASLSVTNPLPTSGGMETGAPVQTAEDRAALRAILLADLLTECRASLPGKLPEGALLFSDTVAATEVLGETYFPAEGQAGETLALTMRLTCAGRYADPADLKSLALAALDANLPDGFAPLSEAVEISMPAAFQAVDDGSVQWTMLAARPLRARVEAASAALLVVGLRSDEAASRLRDKFHLGAPPVIRLTPAWWRWMPFLPFRITVLEAAP